MTRIYTRSGDKGETSLFDGQRTSKADQRVDLYGEVDELNSWIGLSAAFWGEGPSARGDAGAAAKAGDTEPLPLNLNRIQADLLEMGSILAHPDRSAELARKTGDELPFSARPLEEAIDALSERLPALRSFVLPGGHPAAAALQVARAVCRRVERRAVLVQSSQPVPEGVIVYLNRLSDFLFVAARWVGHFTGQQDVIWQPRQERRKG